MSLSYELFFVVRNGNILIVGRIVFNIASLWLNNCFLFHLKPKVFITVSQVDNTVLVNCHTCLANCQTILAIC